MPKAKVEPALSSEERALKLANGTLLYMGVRDDSKKAEEDVLALLAHIGAISSDDLAQLRGEGSKEQLDRLTQEATLLRDWFCSFVERHAGTPLAAECFKEFGPLNRLLAQDPVYQQLGPAAANAPGVGPFQLHLSRSGNGPMSLLMPLAQAIATFICENNFAYVRRCEGIGCMTWFYDGSKGHARRWCSMEICGNRAKAAAHRARLRDGR